MKILCILSAVILAVAFSTLNLFLPFALIIFAAAIGVGILCGLIKNPRSETCLLGRC
jgi:hypothetical protein